MSKATLATHSGAGRVDEAVVLAVPPPEFTKTWRPYAHSEVIKAMNSACAGTGLNVKRKEYGLTKNGAQMFAAWQIEGQGNKEVDFAIGIRNSLDKTLAVGICAGERVFVCDNLVFASDFVIFRKHTGDLELDELFAIARESVKTVQGRFTNLQQWHDQLHSTRLTDAEASLLLIAAMRRKTASDSYSSRVLPHCYYPQFIDLYFGKDSKYEKSLHGFHGAITEIYTQGRGLAHMPTFNTTLKNFIDHEAMMLLTQSHTDENGVIDFTEITSQAQDAATDAREKMRKEAREATTEIREKAKPKTEKEIDEEIEEKIKKAKSKVKKPKGNGKGKTKPKKTAKSPQIAPKPKKKDMTIVVSEGKPKGKSKIEKCSACDSTVIPKARTKNKVKIRECPSCGEEM